MEVKWMPRRIKTYTELITYPSFKERFEYLKETGQIGKDTFGYDRYLNQKFYNSVLWHRIRDKIILRDYGNDLGLDGYPIYGRICIHHLNPISIDDLINQTPFLIDPEYLICTSYNTHEAIHFGDIDLLPKDAPTVRTKYDTNLW